MLLLLIAGLSCGVAAYLVAAAVTAHGQERDASLRRAWRYGSQRVAPTRSLRGRLGGAASSAADLVLRLRPSTDLEAVARKVHAAGLGRRLSARDFLAGRAVSTVFGGVLGLLIAATGSSVSTGMLWLLALCGLGWLGPGLVLRELGRRRRARIRPVLPDALDLLAVSVEAGLGLDGALQKLVERLDGPLADEFELTLGQIRVGESRHRALNDLARRVGVPELTAVVRAIIQAEQQGSSLGRVLRIQAVEARNKRQIAAEAEANKAPVKMLFPTLVFIFPALFLVILGPALLTLTSNL